MPNEQNGRGLARQGVGLLLVWVLAGTCAMLAADQKGNTAAAADAAMVGQHAPYPSSPVQLPPEPTRRSQDPLASMKARQKRELRKMRFDKMKEHASQLAEMAKSLQEDLDNSNENVLSLEVAGKPKRIEKLDTKLRNEAQSGL